MVNKTGLEPALALLGHAARLDQVASVVREVARSLIGCDGITFVVRNGDQCHYVEEDAIAPMWKGQSFPAASCVSGWVMIHGESVVIADVFADARVLHAAYRCTFVKSMAMVPVGRSNAVAAIGAYWANSHEATQSELEMLEAMADSAGMALGV